MDALRVSLVFVFMFLSGCMSAETNSKESDSPDGKYRAYAFVAYGGATTDWIPQVSLARKSLLTVRPINANVFRCTGSKTIDVQWAANDTLLVITGCNPNPSAQNILFQKIQVDGVKIEYKFVSKH